MQHQMEKQFSFLLQIQPSPGGGAQGPQCWQIVQEEIPLWKVSGESVAVMNNR